MRTCRMVSPPRASIILNVAKFINATSLRNIQSHFSSPCAIPDAQRPGASLNGATSHLSCSCKIVGRARKRHLGAFSRVQPDLLESNELSQRRPILRKKTGNPQTADTKTRRHQLAHVGKAALYASKIRYYQRQYYAHAQGVVETSSRAQYVHQHARPCLSLTPLLSALLDYS